MLQCFKQREGKERFLSSHTFPPGSGRGGEKPAEREICEGGELLSFLHLVVQTKKKAFKRFVVPRVFCFDEQPEKIRRGCPSSA